MGMLFVVSVGRWWSRQAVMGHAIRGRIPMMRSMIHGLWCWRWRLRTVVPRWVRKMRGACGRSRRALLARIVRV